MSDDDTVTIACTRNEALALADLIDREIDLENAKPPPPPGQCNFLAGLAEEGMKKAAALRDRLRAA